MTFQISAMHLSHAAALTLILVVFPAAVQAGELESLVIQCDGCHGPNGASTDSDIPIIGGQFAPSIEKALKEFRAWGRPCKNTSFRHGDTTRTSTTMCRIGESLDGTTIRALAEYYAGQDWIASEQDFDMDRAVAGASLYSLYCSTCHPKHRGEAGYASRLSGQWKDYLKTTIEHISTGEWPVPKVMKRKLSEFNPDEIEALLEYFASARD